MLKVQGLQLYRPLYLLSLQLCRMLDTLVKRQLYDYVVLWINQIALCLEFTLFYTHFLWLMGLCQFKILTINQIKFQEPLSKSLSEILWEQNTLWALSISDNSGFYIALFNYHHQSTSHCIITFVIGFSKLIIVHLPCTFSSFRAALYHSSLLLRISMLPCRVWMCYHSSTW